MRLIPKFRNRLGLTQVEFARLCRVSQATVSKWESGRPKPTKEALERIEAAYQRQGWRWQQRWSAEARG